LDFKLIKELKTAVVQYGPTAPFTQVLLDTVVESHLTLLDWKTLCKATLSGGDFLLWDSEWQNTSKKAATLNAQTGNPDWDNNILLGEGPNEGQANQIGFSIGVSVQIAVAAHHAWGKLTIRADVGGSLASIQRGPDEIYQNFVDRLLIAASRILGKSDMGSPFIMQLAYENANTMCHTTIQPHKGQIDLADMSVFVQRSGYHIIMVWLSALLCKGLLYKQCSRGNKGIMHVLCGSLGQFKSDGPKNKGAESGQAGYVPGICPWCRKGNHWAKVCKSKSGILGCPLPGNERRGQPQAPTYSQKTAYGAINLLPSQRDQFF
jgi:hypothetical protein